MSPVGLSSDSAIRSFSQQRTGPQTVWNSVLPAQSTYCVPGLGPGSPAGGAERLPSVLRELTSKGGGVQGCSLP